MINKAILVGRLGQDPEVIVTESGTTIANFSLATSRKYNDKDGNKQEVTEWHKIVAYGRNAELSEQYLNKGSLIFVEGEIRYRSYENKQGETRYITEINAYTIRFLESKGTGTGSFEARAQAQAEQPHIEPKDDLPF